MPALVLTEDFATANTLHGHQLASDLASVVCWQEADTDAWHAARALPGVAWHIPPGSGRPIPISWRTDTWALMLAGQERVHRGIAEVSPDRWISWVLLRHLATGKLVLVVNTHMVSGAWNDKKNARKPWRKLQWRKHKKALDQLVAEERVNADYVVVMGDLNRVGCTIPGLTRISGGGIDQIHVSTGLLREVKVVRLPKGKSDHHPVRAVVTSSKEAPVPPTPPAPTPTGPALITKIATAEVGYHEGRSNGHWNNDQKYSKQLPGFAWSNYMAWCATFVCWCFWKAGLLGLIPKPSASVDELASGFIKLGRVSQFPAVGAIVFFGVETPNGPTRFNGKRYDLNHTGFVTGYDDTYVRTREGNTNDSGSREGDGVYDKKHLRRSSRIVLYGYPDYPAGIDSADPAWQRNQPKPDPKPVPPTPKPTAKPAAVRASELIEDILEEKDVRRDDVTALLHAAAAAVANGTIKAPTS